MLFDFASWGAALGDEIQGQVGRNFHADGIAIS